MSNYGACDMGIKKIVITRAADQGREFVDQVCGTVPNLSEDDFIYEPMLDIETHEVDISSVQFDACIVTSANAIPALKENAHYLGKPIYCVGEKTAQKIKAVLPSAVIHHYNTAQELISSIGGQNIHNRFLYMRGRDTSVDMGNELGQYKKTVHDVVCYTAKRAGKVSDVFINALMKDQIGCVCFFSRRTADIFIDVLKEYAKQSDQKYVDLIKFDVLCISEAVLNCFNTDNITLNAMVSATPDASGMVQVIEEYLRSQADKT